ncbi:unnamed protein product [Symbiodinium sp. CCMP2592]|nr:unnamed protein product [Symbiodinium sp. CCMP2592]
MFFTAESVEASGAFAPSWAAGAHELGRGLQDVPKPPDQSCEAPGRRVSRGLLSPGPVAILLRRVSAIQVLEEDSESEATFCGPCSKSENDEAAVASELYLLQAWELGPFQAEAVRIRKDDYRKHREQVARRGLHQLVPPPGEAEGEYQIFEGFFVVGMEVDHTLEVDRPFEVVKRIIGKDGWRMKMISTECNAKVRLRGRGSAFLECGKEADIPLQINIICTCFADYVSAVDEVATLLRDLYKHYRRFCRSVGQETSVSLCFHEVRRPDLLFWLPAASVSQLWKPIVFPCDAAAPKRKAASPEESSDDEPQTLRLLDLLAGLPEPCSDAGPEEELHRLNQTLLLEQIQELQSKGAVAANSGLRSDASGGSEEICRSADMYPVSGMGKGKNRVPCQVKGKDDGKRRERVKGEEKGKDRGRKEGQAKGKDKGKEQTKGKEKGMRQERAKAKDKGKRQEQAKGKEKGKVKGRGKDLPRADGAVASGWEHRIGKGKGKETNAGYKSKGAGKGKGTDGSKPETSHAEARLGSATDVEPSGSRGSLPEAEATCCSEEVPQLLRKVAGIVQEPIAAMTDGPQPKTPRTLSANPEPPSPVSTTATADLAWVASPDSGSLSCFSASVCASPEPGSTKAALEDLESQEHWPSLAQPTRKAVQDSCLPLQLSAEAGWSASLVQALRLRDSRDRPTSETEPREPSSTFSSKADRNSEQKEPCSSKESTLAKRKGDAS